MSRMHPTVTHDVSKGCSEVAQQKSRSGHKVVPNGCQRGPERCHGFIPQWPMMFIKVVPRLSKISLDAASTLSLKVASEVPEEVTNASHSDP